MSKRKLKDWEIAWGVGYTVAGGGAALVGGASFVAGDVWMSFWFSFLTAVCAMGAFVAFDKSTSVADPEPEED